MIIFGCNLSYKKNVLEKHKKLFRFIFICFKFLVINNFTNKLRAIINKNKQ